MNFTPRVRLLIAALACFCCVSCDSRHESEQSPQPAQAAPTALAAKGVTVASLAPAATDLIIGMGAADHLVAVSNFDFDRPNMPPLPHVGDYQNTDWERLSDLHPGLIIVQMDESRIPAGFRDRAAAIGATVVDVQIEKLADISATLDQLGIALNETGNATIAKQRLRARLDAVHRRVASEAPVPTFLAINDSGTFAAGPGTFLDEILTVAGGKNVLAATTTHWPSIDKERLLELSPDAVVELLPGASPQVQAQAASFWAALPSIPAVASGRTYQITDPWALTPGVEVADLAQRLANLLHPAPATNNSILEAHP